MQFCYTLLIYLALPLIALRLLYRGRKDPDYRCRLSERLGFYQAAPCKSSIWLHAVSLGEVIAATPLIKKLQQQYPQHNIVVTTMTPSGSRQVRKTFAQQVTHVYLPYDIPGAIRRFLRHTNPRLAIIMETELWPNLISACGRNNIPLLIVNARLSPSSLRSYKLIRPLITKLAKHITTVAAQSERERQHFAMIGFPKEKIVAVGNLKFDLQLPSELTEQAAQLRNSWGKQRPIWIAASTHPGEDAIVLDAFSKILEQQSQTLLILVPRHTDRAQEILELAKQRQLTTMLRSSKQAITANTQILIGDTMGELMLLYAASDIVLVCGSLVAHGGHNLLEPAALKLPILSGPHLFNFVAISAALKQANALTIVNDAEQIAKKVLQLFNDAELCQQQGNAAFNVVERNKGSLDKILKLIATI